MANGTWESAILSSYHNASNPTEIARLRKEHPGEERDVVSNSRVLGMIAVTRSRYHVASFPLQDANATLQV